MEGGAFKPDGEYSKIFNCFFLYQAQQAVAGNLKANRGLFGWDSFVEKHPATVLSCHRAYPGKENETNKIYVTHNNFNQQRNFFAKRLQTGPGKCWYALCVFYLYAFLTNYVFLSLLSGYKRRFAEYIERFIDSALAGGEGNRSSGGNGHNEE
jgi:hypothetical protein